LSRRRPDEYATGAELQGNGSAARRARPGTDQIAFHVGEAANTASIKRPVLAPVSAQGSPASGIAPWCPRSARQWRTGRSAAREAVDARHRHDVAGVESVEQFEKLVPVTFSP
jgi:hypothetical protein